jgi:hypothetical protein
MEQIPDNGADDRTGHKKREHNEEKKADRSVSLDVGFLFLRCQLRLPDRAVQQLGLDDVAHDQHDDAVGDQYDHHLEEKIVQYGIKWRNIGRKAFGHPQGPPAHDMHDGRGGQHAEESRMGKQQNSQAQARQHRQEQPEKKNSDFDQIEALFQEKHQLLNPAEHQCKDFLYIFHQVESERQRAVKATIYWLFSEVVN